MLCLVKEDGRRIKSRGYHVGKPTLIYNSPTLYIVVFRGHGLINSHAPPTIARYNPGRRQERWRIKCKAGTHLPLAGLGRDQQAGQDTCIGHTNTTAVFARSRTPWCFCKAGLSDSPGTKVRDQPILEDSLHSANERPC